MSFAAPNALILLIILLPLIWWIGFPRYAFRRRRDISSLVLRTAILVLLVMAIAGFQIVRQVDRMAVVFLVDASDSIGTELRDSQVAYIQDTLLNKPVDDEWALVVFGANVSIDTPFSNISDVPPIRSTILGSNTNLSEAIQTAISLFPADARRRIVILSDGIQTIGDAEAKARLAEASGVEISYVLFPRDDAPDVRISEFTAPARVNDGQEFDITVTVEADEATSARLLIYAGTQLILERDVTLRAGSNNFSLSQESNSTGFLNFSARIIVPNSQDAFTQNNTLGSFSQVVGQPRVLLISNAPEDIVNLLPALQNAGIEVDVIAPSNLPADMGTLASYESIIIVDVPAAEISEAQMQVMKSYVRDLGGGLVFVGGTESFGAGGYYQTTLEEIMPIETQIRDQQRLPRLTLAYLIDSSGSMLNSGDGVFTNLQLAQRAVNLSINLLQPTDRAAVLTFESSGALVAPFQDVNDTLALTSAVNSLETGGGTDILAGLRTAERYMINETSDIKHLILITDGGANPRELVETAERLNTELGVTLSVISIGSNPPAFLQEMAIAGGGNYHGVTNVAQIPNILAQETVLATRSYIEEGDFSINISGNSPILEGISQPPNLRGYIASTPRDTAQVILNAPTSFEDPILVSWQYGLGRTVVFSSDATGRWANNWLGWEDFSRFWGQVVDYSIIESAGNNIETRVLMQDGQAIIEVDARAEDGSFLNNLILQASILDPANEAETIVLQQTAPGRYIGIFEPSVEGAYYIALNGGGNVGGEILQFNEITGWVMSYSPEYAQTAPNETLLSELATITGGSNLAETPDNTFLTTQAPRTAAAPVWQWLVLIALLLLPIDIAVRRVIITRRDMQRLRLWMQGTNPDAVPEARLSSLFEARERARSRTGMGEVEPNALDALRQAKAERRTNSEDVPVTVATSPRPKTEGEFNLPERQNKAADTVSDLLKRKRPKDE